MTYYLIQVAYSQSSAKAMIANPQPREDVIRNVTSKPAYLFMPAFEKAQAAAAKPAKPVAPPHGTGR